MREILTICRAHGRPPSWWETVTPGDRALLVAEHRLTVDEQERAYKRMQRERDIARRGRR